MYKDKEQQRAANRHHAKLYRRRKGMTKGITRKIIPKPNSGNYLILFLMASILLNCFQFYHIFKHEYPKATYVSYVGVDSNGRCATGQEFVNYSIDNKQDIENTAYAIEFFKSLKQVVLVNKWEISNDLSPAPMVKLAKPAKKGSLKAVK